MRKLALLALLALAAWAAGSVAQSGPSDEALLEALDSARFLEASSFTMTMEIVADRPDGTEQAVVQLFFKEIEGEPYSRVEILQPEEMTGQVFVNTPDGTFFWTPDLVTPLKVSSRIEVFGDASVAETSGIQFQEDYSVVERREVALDDGTPALEVKLEATDESVAFPSATVTADSEMLRPLKVRLFALSGDPLNDVTYEEYGDLNGDSYVKKQLIENQLIMANKTLLNITNIEAAELPDELFDPARLGQEG